MAYGACAWISTSLGRKLMKITYFVHDLYDAAVQRRIDMLTLGGAEVTVLGFYRGDRVSAVRAKRVIDLGPTQNGRMVSRAMAVWRAFRNRHKWHFLLDGADVVLARNLECLALAIPARNARRPAASIGYECLDIHRLMLGQGLVGISLRMIEAHLMRACDVLIISSPAFLDNYFHRRHRTLPRALLIENRMLSTEKQDATPRALPSGPPWRIGWFGVIRCARSLRLLAALVTALPGQVEVEIRGRPARDVIPEFDEVIAGTPGLSFLGAYDRRLDLPRLYGAVHFTWAMDFYEAGGNSDWLLPNRLYEGGLFGPVPVASAGSETGRWCQRKAVGLILQEPSPDALVTVFRDLDAASYRRKAAAMAAIPHQDLVYDQADCIRFTQFLQHVAPVPKRHSAAAAMDIEPHLVQIGQAADLSVSPFQASR